MPRPETLAKRSTQFRNRFRKRVQAVTRMQSRWGRSFSVSFNRTHLSAKILIRAKPRPSPGCFIQLREIRRTIFADNKRREKYVEAAEAAAGSGKSGRRARHYTIDLRGRPV